MCVCVCVRLCCLAGDSITHRLAEHAVKRYCEPSLTVSDDPIKRRAPLARLTLQPPPPLTIHPFPWKTPTEGRLNPLPLPPRCPNPRAQRETRGITHG